MNMFKKVEAKTVSEYMESVKPEHKKDVLALHNLIKKISPKLKSRLAYNMLGYGSFKYKNYKKELVNWPILALASQKNYISFYVCCIVDNMYLAEKNKDKLGKVSVGKSCIRFKKLEDVNLDELKKLIKLAEKNPGLVKT